MFFLPVDLTSKGMSSYLGGSYIYTLREMSAYSGRENVRAARMLWTRSKHSAAVRDYGAMLTRAQEGKDPIALPDLCSLFPSNGLGHLSQTAVGLASCLLFRRFLTLSPGRHPEAVKLAFISHPHPNFEPWRKDKSPRNYLIFKEGANESLHYYPTVHALELTAFESIHALLAGLWASKRKNGRNQAMSVAWEIWHCRSQATTWASLSLLLPSWLPNISVTILVTHTTAILFGCPLPVIGRHTRSMH